MKNRFGVDCTWCGYTDGGDTVIVAGCDGCGIPRVLTMTWYYNGSGQNPCLVPGTYTQAVHGPITTTLTYDSFGIWRSDWLPTPCWFFGPSQFFGAPVTPFGCLFYQMAWNCTNFDVFLDVADSDTGAHMNVCNGVIPSQRPLIDPGGVLCPVAVSYTGPGPGLSPLFNHGMLSV